MAVWFTTKTGIRICRGTQRVERTPYNMIPTPRGRYPVAASGSQFTFGTDGGSGATHGGGSGTANTDVGTINYVNGYEHTDVPAGGVKIWLAKSGGQWKALVWECSP